MEEYISDELLVSAYDIHHKALNPPFDFASAIFLDSGGYEASKDVELSDTFEAEHIAKDWTLEQHLDVIANWSSKPPTVFVSFDHPKHRLNTAGQVSRAKELPLPSAVCAR